MAYRENTWAKVISKWIAEHPTEIENSDYFLPTYVVASVILKLQNFNESKARQVTRVMHDLGWTKTTRQDRWVCYAYDSVSNTHIWTESNPEPAYSRKRGFQPTVSPGI